LAALAVLLFAAPAYAAGGPPLMGFINSVIGFLTTVIGPGLFVIGLVFVGFSMMFGNPQAMQRGMSCCLGGAVVFGAGHIGQWLLTAAQ